MKSLPIVCDDGVEPLVGQEGGPTPKVPKKVLAGPELGLANRMFSFRRTTEIRHVAVASSGAYVGVAYAGGQLAVWKLTGNKTVKLRARDHKAEPTTLEFHGSILMSADREGNVRALDVTKNKPLWHLRPTEKLNLGYVRTLLVDGDCLWVCGSGGSARVNLATGELLQALPAYARVLCAGRDAVSGRLALGAVGVVSVFGSDGERLAQYAVGDPTTGVVGSAPTIEPGGASCKTGACIETTNRGSRPSALFPGRFVPSCNPTTSSSSVISTVP